MRKVIFVYFLLAVVLLVSGGIAEAQQASKLYRIGYLSLGDPTSDSARIDAIRNALRERGYVENQNIAIEFRYAEGKIGRAPELVGELVRLKVDIILVNGGAPWVHAAKNATKTIPIIMMSGGSDPVAEGLVDSLAQPGGNVTGITPLARELGGKRLELLKEAIPKLTRVAVIYDPSIPSFVRDVKEVLPSRQPHCGLRFRIGKSKRQTNSKESLLR